MQEASKDALQHLCKNFPASVFTKNIAFFMEEVIKLSLEQVHVTFSLQQEMSDWLKQTLLRCAQHKHSKKGENIPWLSKLDWSITRSSIHIPQS